MTAKRHQNCPFIMNDKPAPPNPPPPPRQRARIEDQPPPRRNDLPAVWDLVVADMVHRDRIGRERYGTPLQPMNGRDALIDLYQELLDAVVYVRQLIFERDRQ